jgi:hypothetical protein
MSRHLGLEARGTVEAPGKGGDALDEEGLGGNANL